MAVQTTKTNKPFNPRGNDQSPKGYNRAALYSGKALDFDGVNDLITTSYTSGFTGAQEFTYCAYVNTNSTTLRQTIIHANENTGYGLQSLQTRDGKFRFFAGTGSAGTSYIDSELYEAGKWYFVVGTHTPTQNKIYLNGVLNATLGAINLTIPPSEIVIGNYPAITNPMNGQIANAKVFDVALTAAQVADLYNNPEKVVPTGVDNTALKLWLPMQEGAGTTAYDGSGNGNHGTISGATYTHGIGAPVSQTAVIDWNKGVNNFTYSEDFANSDWITIDVTKVSTSETDYIGGTTAVNITWLAGSPRYFYQNIGVSGASTLSFYVKSNGGGNKFRLFGNGTLATGSDMTATSEWVRYDFEFTGNASQGIGITQASDNSAADLLVCFAQVETNASVGPYIPTLATAQPSPVLLPQGLTSGRDITGVNLFENVRKQGALNLDGNSWAEVHDNASLDVTTGLTLEAWVYAGSGTDNGVLGKWYYTTNKRSYIIYQAGTNSFRFYTSSNGTNDTYAAATISNGWNHLVGVDDGTNLKFYVNGSEEASVSSLGSIYASDQNLKIGNMLTSSQNFPNPIAQPRIYNRALTAEEVQRNYNAGKNIYTN